MGKNEEDNTRKVAIALEKESGNEVWGGEEAIEQMEEDYLDADRLSQRGDTNPTLLDSATQFKDYLREDTGDTPRIWGYCSTILVDTIWQTWIAETNKINIFQY